MLTTVPFVSPVPRRIFVPVAVVLAAVLAACSAVPRSPAAGAAEATASHYAAIEFARVRAKPSAATTAATDAQGKRIYLETLLIIPGAHVRSVDLGVDEASGRPHVDIVVSEAMGARVLALTRTMVGRRLALLTDGQILQIATVNGVFSTSFRIGAETFAQAAQLRTQLLASSTAPQSTQ